MKLNLEAQKEITHEWFKFLQHQIYKEFEYLEKKATSKKVKPKLFIKKDWKKNNKQNGGGTYYILKNGKIFDKVGVNQSTVTGVFPKNFKSNIPGTKKSGKYWASGISVVAHMRNPKMPALHFNTRFIVTSKSWFGGGMDATQRPIHQGVILAPCNVSDFSVDKATPQHQCLQDTCRTEVVAQPRNMCESARHTGGRFEW